MHSEINRFFGSLHEGPDASELVDDSTVFKARHKIAPSAFFRMNDLICKRFYEDGQPRLWNGHRLLVADGSTLRLENWRKIVEFFGRQEPSNGKPSCPLARISELYDPLNKLTVAASIQPYCEGERSLLVEDERWVNANTLLLTDRGFAAFWLFKWVLDRLGHFCSRLTIDHWQCAQDLLASGASQQIINLKLSSQESRQHCAELNLSTDPITIRLVRVDLPNGEVEVLATSLLDLTTYPIELFAELYHLRWSVEEKFKHDKCRVEMENFSGKSAFTVIQDYYARIFAINLTRLLAYPAERDIQKRYAHCRYARQVNLASAVNAVKQVFGQLFFGRGLDERLRRLHLWFVEHVSIIRPGRKYPRNHKRDRRAFYINYKPCL